MFGSCVNDNESKRSDIDIAVITKSNNLRDNSKLWFEIIGKVLPKYDIKIFETLPLHIKAEIMENYIVIFGDKLEISAYFYKYRKLWRDMKFRYENNKIRTHQERVEGLKRLRRLKKQLLERAND